MAESVYRAICYHPEDGFSAAPAKEGIKACIGAGNIFWLDLSDPADAAAALKDAFQVHSLILSELTESPGGISKALIFDDSIYVQWLVFDAKGKGTMLKVCLGERFLVTLHNEPLPELDRVFGVAGVDGEQFRHGPATILYNILDDLVDKYFVIIDEYSVRIDGLEDTVFSRPDPQSVRDIFSMKREVLEMRLALSPQREAVNSLLRHDVPLISRELDVYYQDLYDHLVRATDSIDIFRDIIAGTMDIYLSSVSNRLNEIMKVLTVVSTIILPMTLVAGIYGQNFRHMPELLWRYGYAWSLGIMLAIGVGMLFWLKRRDWL